MPTVSYCTKAVVRVAANLKDMLCLQLCQPSLAHQPLPSAL